MPHVVAVVAFPVRLPIYLSRSHAPTRTDSHPKLCRNSSSQDYTIVGSGTKEGTTKQPRPSRASTVRTGGRSNRAISYLNMPSKNIRRNCQMARKRSCGHSAPSMRLSQHRRGDLPFSCYPKAAGALSLLLAPLAWTAEAAAFVCPRSVTTPVANISPGQTPTRNQIESHLIMQRRPPSQNHHQWRNDLTNQHTQCQALVCKLSTSIRRKI